MILPGILASSTSRSGFHGRSIATGALAPGDLELTARPAAGFALGVLDADVGAAGELGDAAEHSERQFA